MKKERVQTRLSEEYADSVEKYAEKQGITQSEAVRRLIRIGYIRKTCPEPEERWVQFIKMQGLNPTSEEIQSIQSTSTHRSVLKKLRSIFSL